MTTGVGAYVVPFATDTDAASATVFETTIVAQHGMVDIGGRMAHAETFNGAIPGPTIRLNVNDTLIVRLINELDHPTSIHWHGIELPNSSDGTEVTQDGVYPMMASPPPPPAPAGGTYLYKFKVPRPGLYWYHPHHGHATNRVFRGMYGMIIVNDPHEAALIAAGVLPNSASTRQLVLSDITICKAPGSNDAATYVDPTTLALADRAEWLSGATSQPAPTPATLCQIPTATNDHGMAAAASFLAMEVPSMVRSGRLNEGQTVLTNGEDVGGRLGPPAAPGPLSAAAQLLPVLAGQGLRLQIANCSITRYFRLFLTTSAGVPVPIVRIGGEGGLLDAAVLDGGIVGGYNMKYSSGEILLPPGSRADVVVAIPPTAVGVLTLWTRDYQRNGATFAALPTVPVMHLNVTGPAASTYSIAAGAPLRASIGGTAVETLGPATGTLLDPAVFAPPKLGMSSQAIQFTTPPSVDGVVGSFDGFVPYGVAPHLDSSRYAEAGRILELAVSNQTAGHHPFHVHGFSIQPISLTMSGSPSFVWPYREFRDNVDIPPGYTLTFRIRTADRELKDGVASGGALGRWLFHCHIFLHHHQGMIGELVVTAADGSEKPDIDVRGSWEYTPAGGIAHRTGTYHHPEGDPIGLTASAGTVVDLGAGEWDWTLDTTGVPNHVEYVYITGTDPAGRQDQAVFRLKIGAPDDGADNGDPHVHTVDGRRYDFQGVGEFTLLRDAEGMEIQARHWPVQTATPVTDPATGLVSCVSVLTAVAARVGDHQIAFQLREAGDRELTLFLDGKPYDLPYEGLDLGPHRVSASALEGGAASLRVDFANQAVLTVTPYFWSSYNIWLLNVSVSHTQADEGIMGITPPGSWLPALRDRTTVGSMPPGLHDRYVTLYRTFANSWRVSEETSLFVYPPGTSSKSFRDDAWPPEEGPCTVKPEFEIPGANPPDGAIPLEAAEKICANVTIDGLHEDCVFDVAATGDEGLATAYLIEQEQRLRGSAVQLHVDRRAGQRAEAVDLVATVLPLRSEGLKPTGTVNFIVDGQRAGRPMELDKFGRALLTIDDLKPGEHSFRADYAGGGQHDHKPSSSPNRIDIGRRAAGEGRDHPHRAPAGDPRLITGARSAPTSDRANAPIVVIGLVAATAAIHASRALVAPEIGVLFGLNAAGYLGLIGLLYAPLPALVRWRGAMRWVLIGYTVTTIVFFFLWGAMSGDWPLIGFVDKAIEVALVALLLRERRG